MGRPGTKDVGDETCIRVWRIVAIDGGDERFGARQQRYLADVGDLAGRRKIASLQNHRLRSAPACHRFSDSRANSLVDIMVSAEQTKLRLIGEDTAQFDVRAAVAEPALHLHLGVGQWIARRSSEQCSSHAFERDAPGHDISRHEDRAEIARRCPLSRVVQFRVVDRSVICHRIAVDHGNTRARDQFLGQESLGFVPIGHRTGAEQVELVLDRRSRGPVAVQPYLPAGWVAVQRRDERLGQICIARLQHPSRLRLAGRSRPL